ncbi:MAG: alanine--tRNA ligase-related protein, partial [bacterium]
MGDPDVLEIWNLVFIQFNREPGGVLTPLPARHVDTGMGLERVTSIIQGVDGTYDTDLLRPMISVAERRSGRRYGGAMTEQDLAAYAPEWVTPIQQDYRGHTLHEIPPNGQGIA